ncbi:hypothetical protein GF352_00685 [archaeon]|nr:hypothetical protein [archaeon]
MSNSIKKDFTIVVGLIITLPLPFIGFMLWVYSELLSGLWFYLFLPLMLMTCFFTYLVSIIGLSIFYYKLQEPLKEGVFSTDSKEMKSWIASQLVLNIIAFFRNLRIPPPAIRRLYCNTFRTRFGNILVHAGFVEHSLVDVGDNVVIGNNSEIWGHMIKGDEIIIKKVRIGNNVTIGAKSLVMPGVEIGNGTIVGACSLVPKNKKLEPNSLYLGIPVRKVKDL